MSIRNLTSFGSNLNLASVKDLKSIQTSHSLCSGCGLAGKPLQLIGQEAEFKFESKFEPPAGHLAISLKAHWQAVTEGNQRFRGQNQLPSSWGSSLALLGLVA